MRRVCYTLNNYSDEEYVAFKDWERPSYNIVGREVGAEGTPHLQGYAEFPSAVRLTTLKKFNGRAHWEAAKGNAKSNIAYCSKEDSGWVARGEPKVQGKRNDLCEVRQRAKDEGMRGVTLTCNMQQIKVAEKYLTYHEDTRDWEPEVYWYWGPTGTGKSRDARIECNRDDVYVKNNDSKWWDRYDGHECVIIDDFRDSWWPLTVMLALLDRYEYTVEVKGGTRQFRPRRIWVTSAFSPMQCYRGTGESINQLLRRIKIIKNYSPATDVSVTEVGGVILGPPDCDDLDNVEETGSFDDVEFGE